MICSNCLGNFDESMIKVMGFNSTDEEKMFCSKCFEEVGNKGFDEVNLKCDCGKSVVFMNFKRIRRPARFDDHKLLYTCEEIKHLSEATLRKATNLKALSEDEKEEIKNHKVFYAHIEKGKEGSMAIREGLRKMRERVDGVR